MPGFLYKSFCHSTINDIANIIKSDPYINLGTVDGLTKFISYTNTGPNWINAVTATRPYGGVSTTNTLRDQLIFYPPPCDYVGKYSPGSGFDSLETILSQFFTFDPTLFELIIGGSLTLFAMGLGAKHVVQTMRMK